MTLAPGARIGPYSVVGALGAGGMGEVYRATDTNLGRQVAIKVLPEAFAHDAERLARFEREARTLASLSHPNIAIVHGFEQSQGTRALVMELVEGPTLADRIERGPLPLDEALPIATQIARALEAAHEQGIVHRDLKPANVKVTPDGVVKVLDFGLAKALEPAAASQPAAPGPPTITTPAMTQAGVILGTAAYMSPEQAKGRGADKRCDVWAFGCVLYEMLTGRRAFPGEDISDTLASILKTEPDWTALPAEVPPALKALIQRCLQKDRRERVADLAAASFVLADARAFDDRQGRERPQAEDSARSKWALAGPMAAAVIGTTVLFSAGAWMLRPSRAEPVVARFSLRLSDDEQLTVPARRLVALSRDGRQIAWAGVGARLFVRSVSELDAHAIPGTEGLEGVGAPAFSPDGGELAFHAGPRVLRVPVAGGPTTSVCDLAAAPYGLWWGDTGILIGQPGGIVQCSLDRAEPERLAEVADDEQAYGPQWLPGERALLYTVAKTSDGMDRWERAQLVVQTLGARDRKVIVENASDGRYLATGHLLYALGGTVFAAPFDVTTNTLGGKAAPVLEGVRRSFAATTGVAHYATSDTGHLVYVPGPVRPASSFLIATADRAGTLTVAKAPAVRYQHVRANRDGSMLAVEIDDEAEDNISILELNGASALRRLTFGGNNRFPVWSPDGQRIAFQSDREGDRAIFAQRTDGTGLQRLTRPEPNEEHIPESWSPDGRWLSFARLQGSSYSLWTLSLRDGAITQFRDLRSLDPFGSTFSPDGRWIAYHALPSGVVATSSASGVYVEPFPPTGALYQAPKVGRDFQPFWSRTGAELFYVGNTVSGQLVSVPVSTQSGLTFGRPALLPFVLTAGRLSTSTRAFDSLPGGGFVGIVAESMADRAGGTPEIRVVLNWFSELKRLVPTGR